MLHVLNHLVYRRLFLAQIIALTGTGLATVALGLLAYQLDPRNAGGVLGTALAVKMVAYVFVAPLATAAVVGLPRRAVMVGSDVVRLTVSLPFMGQVWQVYVLIFVLQAASATFTPTFQSVIPDILPEEENYTAALSLSRLAYDLEAVLSPMLAAVLLLVVPSTALFFGTGIGFAGSAVLVVSTVLPRRDTPSDGAPDVRPARLWDKPPLGDTIMGQTAPRDYATNREGWRSPNRRRYSAHDHRLGRARGSPRYLSLGLVRGKAGCWCFWCENRPMGRESSDEAYVMSLCDVVLGEAGLRQHRFNWLVGDPGKNGQRTKLPDDGYWPGAGIVVEYRERQHDQSTPHFDKVHVLTISGVHRGLQRALYDARREEVIPAHGIRLVIVRMSDLDATARELRRNVEHDLDALRRVLTQGP